jgi:hypothetical protein
MPEYLGEFEQVVLLAVLRLGKGAYGVPIRREIEGRTGRAVSVGALYSTLDRLESKGYLHSWFGERLPSAAAVRNGISRCSRPRRGSLGRTCSTGCGRVSR